MDRGAWWTTVHGGCKESDTTEWLTLSLFTYVPRRADRSYSTFKVRRGGGEEIILIQGKRNPSKMVGVVRGYQRADTLKP